jgi:hypothetical protein
VSIFFRAPLFPRMADTLKPVPAKGLHVRNVDPAAHRLQVAVSRDGIILYIPHIPFLVKNLARGLHVRYNRLKTAIWPVHPLGAITSMVGFAGWVLSRPSSSWLRSGSAATAIWNLDALFPWTKQLPVPVRVGYLSLIAVTIALGILVETQRAVLRSMLGYHGWLFEDPKKFSLLTKIWFIIVRFCYVRAPKPLLWSYQDSLPHLPVPPLGQTCKTLLTSMEPLMSPEEFEALQEKCATFQQKEGRKLQWYLYLKSWVTKNYVSDWWLRFVYLRGRGSILVYSNYFGCGDLWPIGTITHNREARAASFIHQYIVRKQEIDHEEMQPLRVMDMVPLCMNQYQYMFSTTRIPGLDTDDLQQYEPPDSRYVAVLHKGSWYRVNVFTPDRRRHLTPYELQVLLRSIVDNAKEPESPAHGNIAALTTENRAKWAQIRETHFYRGLNKSSLDTIEKAMFAVILDEASPATLSEQSSLLLAGDGTNRWCDKSFCLVVFKNGRSGLHAEHSWGDAPVVSHVTEICLASEAEAIKSGTLRFDADGYIVGPEPPSTPASPRRHLLAAQQLSWQMTPDLQIAVEQAVVQAKENVADLQLESICFAEVNRGVMKGCRLPPDAFVQMALQLAFYRMERRFVPTYEPAMMRLYRSGRTETIRSCSSKSCAWVKAMEDPTVPAEERRCLLKVAAEDHQARTKQAMAGQGIDRHLFALYVVARGMDINSPFLEQVLGYQWTLSTSQVPWRQANKADFGDIDWSRVAISSGGFGPVDQSGYGCCYNFMDDTYLLMHISSRKSAPNTDSKKMMDSFTTALRDMVALFKS